MDRPKCPFYSLAREQRVREMNAGAGTRGTRSYEDKGCFDCEGFDKKCESYLEYLEFELFKI